MVEEPVEDPCEYQQGDDEDRDQPRNQAGEEEPVSPRMASWLFDVAYEELVVAAVGLPSDVEGVAEERDGADDYVERKGDCHPGEGDVGDAAHPGGEDKYAGGKSREDVSYGRDEANYAVEAEVDLGARNAEAIVEQMGEDVEVFVAEEASTRAEPRGLERVGGGKDFGSFRLGHIRLATCETTVPGKYENAWTTTLEAGFSASPGLFRWYTWKSHGGYSSVAERRSVDPDVVGSTPTSRPKLRISRVAQAALFS